MNQEAKSQEFLRKLAMVHEGFVQDKARLGLELTRASAIEPKTAALIVVGTVVAIGASAACLRWSVFRALGAGATQDEIADVLLAIAPVARLGCVVSAAPDIAVGLGYDVEAALFELDEPTTPQSGAESTLAPTLSRGEFWIPRHAGVDVAGLATGHFCLRNPQYYCARSAPGAAIPRCSGSSCSASFIGPNPVPGHFHPRWGDVSRRQTAIVGP